MVSKITEDEVTKEAEELADSILETFSEIRSEVVLTWIQWIDLRSCIETKVRDNWFKRFR